MATVAEILLETLILSDVSRVYGLPGDSLNGFTNSISEHKEIQWIHVRHEEAELSQDLPGMDLPGIDFCINCSRLWTSRSSSQ